MKRTVELLEVAELTGLPLFVERAEVPADVCARGSRITRLEELIAFAVHHVAGNATLAVIAVAFRLIEISAQLCTLSRCGYRSEIVADIPN